MFNMKCIELAIKERLTTYNSIPPRIYGLPKIHRSDVPLHPVVASFKAPTYKLSEFLASILTCTAVDSLNTRSSLLEVYH